MNNLNVFLGMAKHDYPTEIAEMNICSISPSSLLLAASRSGIMMTERELDSEIFAKK